MIILVRRSWFLALYVVPLFCLGGAFGRLFLADRPPGATVVIDPGHGGIDGGCQDAQGNLEKDLNLAIARRVAFHLGGLGYTAVLTRAEDRALGETYGHDLQARLDMARLRQAYALISIHANWVHDPSAQGALAVIPPGSPRSEDLAKTLLERLRGLCEVNPRPLVMPDHPLLVPAPFPMVLLETGFLSNPSEAARLQQTDYRDAVGRCVALGIRDYLRAHRSLEQKPIAPKAPPR